MFSGLEPVENGKNWSDSATEEHAETAFEPNKQRFKLLCMMGAAGCISGAIALLYDFCMESLLWFTWEFAPHQLQSLGIFDGALADWTWCYTVIAAMVMCAAAGASIKVLGFPGDLPNVVECIHKAGFVPLQQAPAMAVCSLFSIAAGGSLGPEAPLVAICSSVCGYVSQRCGQSPDMVRKFTLMGMSAGLSAFFGVALGGALFALEVCHTMGYQFYEIAVHAVGAGTICLCIYRGVQSVSFGAIWAFPQAPACDVKSVVIGALLGLVGAALGRFFAVMHRNLGRLVRYAGLGNFEDRHATSPIALACAGGLVISAIGVLLPATMFWSEIEINSLAGATPLPLPHIWPAGGLFHMDPFPWNDPLVCAAVVFAKLLAISLSVAAGLRGGFIFPLMFTGCVVGRGLESVFGTGGESRALLCMCVAASLNVSVTRTPFATALILTSLSGQADVAVPVLASALVALFATEGRVFFAAQRDRSDLQFKAPNTSKDAMDVSRTSTTTVGSCCSPLLQRPQRTYTTYAVEDDCSSSTSSCETLRNIAPFSSAAAV